MAPQKTSDTASHQPAKPTPLPHITRAEAEKLILTPENKSHMATLSMLNTLRERGECEMLPAIEESWGDARCVSVRVPLDAWMNTYPKESWGGAVASLKTGMEVVFNQEVSFALNKSTPYHGQLYHYVEFQFKDAASVEAMEAAIRANTRQIVDAIRPLCHDVHHDGGRYIM